MVTIEEVMAEEVIESGFAWLCEQRKHYPVMADIWRFRHNWTDEKASLRADLVMGSYQIGLLTRVTLRHREEVDLWSARDALVMKCLTLVLTEKLSISRQCTHIKGLGGSKAAVRQVLQYLPANRFVLKTDVKAYYASIDHQLLLDQLAAHITDLRVLNLVGQYLRRCAEWGGLYWEPRQGIALGCPLSPILGAFFLSELDARLERLGLFFVRFMDDIVVLAPTRWTLRKAVKVVNEVLASLRLVKHPDKTFIGRIDKGFTFLGYHIAPNGLSVAHATVEHFMDRARRLYEQEPKGRCASKRLGAYVRRWWQWVGAGLADVRWIHLFGCIEVKLRGLWDACTGVGAGTRSALSVLPGVLGPVPGRAPLMYIT
jgi:hypothetical protein